MSQYVPLRVDILDSPKVMKLPPDVFRFWTLCLLCAQRWDYVDGELPDVERIAHWTRTTEEECERMLGLLAAAGLVEVHDDDRRMHDWGDWRDVKDRTSTQRKRKWSAARKTAKDSENGVATPEERHGNGVVTPEERHGNGVVTPEKRLTSNLQQTTDNTQQTTHTPHADAHEERPPRLGGEPIVCVGGKFVEESPSASTPEEIDRLVQRSTAVLNTFTNGDGWIRHLRVCATTWPAAWIEEAVPLLASQLVDDPRTTVGWLKAVLKRWAAAGGPPAPVVAAASPRGQPAAKPRSARDQKFDALWEAARDDGDGE